MAITEEPPAGLRPRTRGMLLAPLRFELEGLRRAIISAAQAARIQLTVVDDVRQSADSLTETIFSEILRADVIVAVLSDSSPNVYYEVGLAHATGKPVIFVVEQGSLNFLLSAARSAQAITYDPSPDGIEKLRLTLRRVFADFRSGSRRPRFLSQLASSPASRPVVDLDRLEPRNIENLCFELLTQMGYRRVEWGKQLEEIDVVATLPKKDPDGFEYHELWLISLGLRAPSEMLVEMATTEPRYILRQLRRPEFREQFKADVPVTLLLILLRESRNAESIQRKFRRAEQRFLEGPFPYNGLRLRVWDRAQVVSLIQQYPQLAHKYFSEEGRVQSTSRKSVEQLYLENMRLTETNQATISALKAERDKSARLERDAAWKDVAFTAAHKLGNPIFALETNLQGLKRKIASHPDEALTRAADMDESIETAKVIIEQFKSLTRAKQISKRPVDLLPLIETASRVAENHGVKVTINADKRPPQAQADPVRMTECFDELFANALHWVNKSENTWQVVVAASEAEATMLLAQHPVDAVITDLVMTTSQSGMEVLRAAKSKDPLIMVILITAFEKNLDRYNAFELGAFDCVQKNMPGIIAAEEIFVKTQAALRFRALASQEIAYQKRLAFMRRYSDPRVFQTLEKNPDLLNIRRDTVTICFWDIRGFSKLCESLKAHPTLIADFLKAYFDAAANVIFEHHGVLDKYVGDGVMGLFGALEHRGDQGREDAGHAVDAAIELRRQFNALLGKWLPEWTLYTPEEIEVGIGCGIHTGEVLVGAVGTDLRDQFTALGPHVNFAARIEARSTKDQVLVSASTQARITDHFVLQEAGAINDVKNIPGEYRLFTVVARK